MAIYAIGDLHMPGHQEKPMNVFGAHWERHFDVIRENWLSVIKPEDTVLIPGDISWAMQMEDVRDDLNEIASLPGKKLILRGNHDYWWNSIGKVRAMLGENMHAIQNDAIEIDGVVYCGTRGWSIPFPGQPFSEQDEKIYQREILRLEMTLQAATKYHLPIVVMMHFPPFDEKHADSPVTEMLERYGVRHAIYAHLHGKAHRLAFSGERNGINYIFAAADYLHFCPIPVV